MKLKKGNSNRHSADSKAAVGCWSRGSAATVIGTVARKIRLARRVVSL
jgi:hypothetical protein